MHRLDPAAVPVPCCLKKFKHGQHQWGDLGLPDKREVRDCLRQLQGGLCAYCEGSLDQLGEHVEHFRTRSGHPELTFDWGNLYWSCGQHDSCGNHKDTRGKPYHPDHLINPRTEDPDMFFKFRADGTIAVRDGLSAADEVRARETIRVFSLDYDYGRLRRMRQNAIRAYDAQEPGIIDCLMEMPVEDRRLFVREELEKTASQPFCTVIRHYLGGLDR